MKTLRAPVLLLALAAAACNSSQPASANDGGSPAGDATLPEAGDAAGEAGDDSTVAEDVQDAATSPCVAIEAGTLAPSEDCLLLGPCPVGCGHGTASAYACAPDNAGNATYPSAFLPPADPVHVIEYAPGAGPWDGGAYVSCAPLACVRWSLADNGPGGSAWAADPCSNPDATNATEAWVCPSYQGFQPGMAGCFNAGAGQEIGGAGTGMVTNVVWCCPSAFEDGGGEGGGGEGGPAAEAGTGDASATEGGSDAGTDATPE
jgi:hypothetical protein